MLTVLRDLGQPLPAGAVLISPWVDLTHSFPSIHTNTATDIIPPHGFMNKPSVLWPVDPIKEGRRIARAHSDPLLKPCRADIPGSDKHATRHTALVLPTDAKKPDSTPVGSKHQLLSIPLKSQQKTSFSDGGKCDLTGRGHGRSRDQNRNPSNTIPMDELAVNRGSVSIPDLDDIDFWQPNPPKVLMKNPGDVPLEIRSQIQHYAMTEQLSHPLVSPILQASLGNSARCIFWQAMEKCFATK